MLKYYQKSFNSCCFSSLASAFAGNKETKAVDVISMCIEESFNIEVGNRIDFSNAILKNEKKLKEKK